MGRVFFLAFLLSISIFSSPESHGAGSRVFTFRLTGEPETLDWNKAHTPVETYILMNLMEGLVSVDSRLRVVPALAKSWAVSPDGKTYTFKLRPGVKWSDGVPVKAQDFVYGWKRLLSPLTAAAYADFLLDIEGAEAFAHGRTGDFSTVGVKAVDDSTFQVRLTRPVPHWIYIPSFWVTFPMREDIIRKFGSNGWAAPGKMVTTGPFTLEAHDFDSRIVLRRNPLYYGSHGNLDQAIAVIVRDDSTALSLYEAGKLDFLTDISTLDLERLSSRPDLKRFPYLKTGYLGFVTDKYPLQDIKIRRAIAMAIDKTKIGEVLHGGQVPATSFVPPPMFGYSKTLGLPFNPERAKHQLRDSGVDLSQAMTLELVLPNFDKQITLGQFIQAELKKNIGLNVVLEPFDNKTFRSQLDLHSFPIYAGSWAADFPDPDNYLSVFVSSSGNNHSNWKDANFDTAVSSARGLQDRKAREKAYVDLQRTLVETSVVLVPLYYEPNTALVKPRAQGVILNPLNYLYLRNVNVN